MTWRLIQTGVALSFFPNLYALSFNKGDTFRTPELCHIFVASLQLCASNFSVHKNNLQRMGLGTNK